MFGSDFAVLRGAPLLLAMLLTACDDPLEPRQAPAAERLALFALLDPDGITTPILVQQPHGPSLMLEGTLRTGGTIVGRDSAPPMTSIFDLGLELNNCFRRYRPGNALTSPWMFRCLEMEVTPQFGATYEVTVSAPGTPTVRGTTTVPGDFEVVSHELEFLPSGDARLDVRWRSSAQVYRYLVAIVGSSIGQRFECQPDTTCFDRWFTVTNDTAISTTVSKNFFVFRDTMPFHPAGVAVYALSREMYGYMLTGVSSDYFPVPPAQNAVGGIGAVGAWVRRVAITSKGFTVTRTGGGIRVTNHNAVPYEYEIADEGSSRPHVRCHFKSPPDCPIIAPGATVFVPDSSMINLDKFTQNLSLLMWSPTEEFVHIPIFFH